MPISYPVPNDQIEATVMKTLPELTKSKIQTNFK